MLLCFFVAVNWIYSRTQLSGWMPLPFSIWLLVGAAFQTFVLVGKLRGPASKFAQILTIAGALLLVMLSMSALFIFSLSQEPTSDVASAEGISTPARSERQSARPAGEGIVVPEESLFIDVRSKDYGFGPDGKATTDLESLIARYQQLISRNPEQHVLITAGAEVDYMRVIEVFNALKAAGISNVDFTTASK